MTPERYAAIDVGTNTVLLLVAERAQGGFRPVVERADITRLGRGVDRTRRLDPNAVRETVEATCPCEAAGSHGTYTRCARQVVQNAVAGLALRQECRRTVLGIVHHLQSPA